MTRVLYFSPQKGYVNGKTINDEGKITNNNAGTGDGNFCSCGGCKGMHPQKTRNKWWWKKLVTQLG